jgi:hypothetical protein
MHALPWLLLMTIAAGGTGVPAGRVWDEIFDGGDSRAVSLIEATGRDDWVVAGGLWGVATARAGRVSITPTPGHGVLGLFPESPRSLYALGEGELIWHFDGASWTEEHIAPLPPRGRRPFAEHMLYLAHHEASMPGNPLVAIGLTLALVKRTDGAWALPPRAEQDKLRDIGLLGPAFAAPARCDRAGWRWLGTNRGAFYCHDRRMFIWDAGAISPKGAMPGLCFDALDALIEVNGALYASCRYASLWTTEGEVWRRLATPKQKGLKEISSLSYADGCLFAAGDRKAWRHCEE